MKILLTLIFLITLLGCSTTPSQKALGPDQIESTLVAKEDSFRACNNTLFAQPTTNTKGRVLVRFVIGANGQVTEAKVKETSLKRPETEECILKTIRGIQFPVPAGNGTIVVNYPFKFL